MTERKLTVKERFEDFDRKHPEVYQGIVDLCRKWRGQGRGKWSVWSCFAVLRWERRIAGLPDPEEAFKLSNDYTPHYARKVMAENADLDGIFNIKQLRRA